MGAIVFERFLRSILHWLIKPRVYVPLLVLMTLLGGILGFRGSRIAGIPDVGDPFDVEAFSFVEVPDNDNAYTHYKALIPRFKNFSSSSEHLDQAFEKGWQFANDDVKKWVDDHAAVMQDWRTATEYAVCVPVPAEDIRKQQRHIDGISEIGIAKRLALLNAYREMDSGNMREAWSWIKTALRTSRHWGQNGPLIDRLVGQSIFAGCASPIRNWAEDSRTDRDLLRQGLADVISIYEMTALASHTMKAEYLYIAGSVNRPYSVQVAEDGGGHPNVPESLRGAEGFLFFEPEVSRRTVRLYFTDLLAHIDRPRRLRPANAHAAEIERGLRESLLLTNHLEAYSLVDGTLVTEQTRQADHVLTLALHCHFREHGEFPTSLDSLIGRYLNEIPVDPYGKGEPMRYRRASSPDDGVIFWSVGKDVTDDAGLKEYSGIGSITGDIIFRIKPPSLPKRQDE